MRGESVRTRIVCTVGPATATEDGVHALAEIGADVVRLNFAHGTHDAHRQVIGWVRAASLACGRPLAVLADLAGPKIRVGALPEPVRLTDKHRVTIAPEGQHHESELPCTYDGLARDVHPGDRILVDDGNMELRVQRVEGVRVACSVVRGGLLREHKGLNLPGVRVSAPALSDKDLEDLEFAIAEDVDYIGLSFVQSAADVLDLRKRIPRHLLIVAKIEKDTALDQLDAILTATDAVMVARGDLGVELPFEQVPLAQKRIIEAANLHGRPVITATQMLESMMSNPRPTRAEASDVANALLDGTDAVMLSGETAMGQYPLLALEAMVRIAAEVERSPASRDGPHYDLPAEHRLRSGSTPTQHAIASAVVQAVTQLDAPAVVTFTRTGSSARLVSSYRPPVPIVAVCDQERTARQLALVWGVESVRCHEERNYGNMLACARAYLLDRHLARPGQRIVVTAGIPFNVPGTTNLLRVEEL
ncbi:MAG: pyruvate kinase [Gemmatimonadetes bacterium]|nr:pyruvate kinase [Gemmatimonadota bacterium]